MLLVHRFVSSSQFTNEPYQYHVAIEFDTLSSVYDKGNRLMSLGLDTFFRRRAICQYTGARVLLEIGTGTGVALQELQEQHQGSSVIGVDISKKMLLLARQRMKNTGYLVRADAYSLPFRDSTYELIASFFALRHFFDKPRLFSELFRVTKMGGKLLLQDMGTFQKLWYRPAKFWITTIMPTLARLVFWKQAEVFQLIPWTFQQEYPPAMLKTFLQQANWKDVHVQKLFFGSVMILTATKAVKKMEKMKVSSSLRVKSQTSSTQLIYHME